MAQRTGRRIARIGKGRFAGRNLGCVQFGKIGVAHIDLAAYLHDIRYIVTAKHLGDIVQGPEIDRNIFTDRAVTSGRTEYESPALVAQ